MAFISTPDDDELQKTQGLNTSGVVGATTASGGTGNGNGPAVDTKAPTGTGFVNLQQYLDANKGTGAKLAGDATKDLSGQADSFKTEASNTASGAKGDFGAATGDDTAADLNKRLGSDASGAYSDASKYLGQNYSGPQAQDYTSTLKADSDTLQQNLNKADDPYTQQTLLKNAYGQNGNYTSGFGALDQFLLSGDQSGRDVISGVKAKAGDVGNEYNDAAGQINQGETDARAKLAANQQSVRDAATAAEGNILSGANAKVNQLNQGLSKVNLGSSQASLGDTLTDKNQLDLKALSSLIGSVNDPNWYKKTFSAGSAPQVIRGTASKSITPPAPGTDYQGSGISQVAHAGSGAGSPIYAPSTPSVVNQVIDDDKKQLKKLGL